MNTRPATTPSRNRRASYIVLSSKQLVQAYAETSGTVKYSIAEVGETQEAICRSNQVDQSEAIADQCDPLEPRRDDPGGASRNLERLGRYEAALWRQIVQDAVCSPNGQTPINCWSAASWILPDINPASFVCGGSALGCSSQWPVSRAIVRAVSLIFLTKIGFVP
jgi:hypothetical protein